MTTQDRRDIHEAIAEWHETGPDGVELHGFLGLTWEQYKLWMEGGPLPKGGRWYDGVRHAARQGESKEDRQRLKLARRRAQGELAMLHRAEYMQLLAKHRKLLNEEAALKQGTVSI
jgi:hypothetical protein